MTISGSDLTLRAIEQHDAKFIHQWVNDDQIQRSLVGWHFPLSLGHIEKWIETFEHDSHDQRLMIEKANERCGLINLTAIDLKNGSAKVGILVAPEHQRRGIGLAALHTLINYAFCELSLNRLETTILKDNSASVSLFESKLGFVREGIKRHSIYKNGAFQDEVLLGLLRDDTRP